MADGLSVPDENRGFFGNYSRTGKRTAYVWRLSRSFFCLGNFHGPEVLQEKQEREAAAAGKAAGILKVQLYLRKQGNDRGYFSENAVFIRRFRWYSLAVKGRCSV